MKWAVAWILVFNWIVGSSQVNTDLWEEGLSEKAKCWCELTPGQLLFDFFSDIFVCAVVSEKIPRILRR